MTMIDQRPAEVETRLEAGHGEGDLGIGVGSVAAMVTLREWNTQFGIIVNMPPDHTAASVNTAINNAFAGWSGPRMLDGLIKLYVMAVLLARYSSGLR
jgi:IS30 family transposase